MRPISIRMGSIFLVFQTQSFRRGREIDPTSRRRRCELALCRTMQGQLIHMPCFVAARPLTRGATPALQQLTKEVFRGSLEERLILVLTNIVTARPQSF